TAVLLKAAALFQAEYYVEAEHLLTGLRAQRALRPAEERLLGAAYERMGRWEEVPPGQTEYDHREGRPSRQSPREEPPAR
ncbi:MAG: hypothetical protein AB1505_07030, partial [Candidatus Latescibacterota bacterium]